MPKPRKNNIEESSKSIITNTIKTEDSEKKEKEIHNLNSKFDEIPLERLLPEQSVEMPSTSRDAIEKLLTKDTSEPPAKKRRIDYDYWANDESDIVDVNQDVERSIQYVKINQLQVGKL